MKKYDLHTHTEQSHDSLTSPENACLGAIKNGLDGIAFTDHCDVEFSEETDVITPIKRSVKAAEEMRLKFGNRLEVFSGVEIGEGLWHADTDSEVLNACAYDEVIRSVHAVRYKNHEKPYSAIDFSDWSDEKIRDYLKTYFSDLKETLKTLDGDIAAHITCPLRYIAGKYGKSVDMSVFKNDTDEILKTIISCGYALEINTSNLVCGGSGILMPDKQIISRYRELNGELITLGSDAHVPENSGIKFDKIITMLKAIGFSRLYKYEKRKPVSTEIN